MVFADGTVFRGAWEEDEWLQSAAEPALCRMTGPGLQGAVAGQKAEFVIQVRVTLLACGRRLGAQRSLGSQAKVVMDHHAVKFSSGWHLAAFWSQSQGAVGQHPEVCANVTKYLVAGMYETARQAVCVALHCCLPPCCICVCRHETSSATLA